MTNSIKDEIFYLIYPLGFCGVINNKEKSTKNLGLNKIDKKSIKPTGLSGFRPVMYCTDTHKYTLCEQILEIKYGLLYNYQGSRQYLAKMLAYYFVVYAHILCGF